jgi:hypothetical protein
MKAYALYVVEEADQENVWNIHELEYAESPRSRLEKSISA